MIKDAPDLKFDEIYGGGDIDDLYQSRFAPKKSTGSQGSALSRLQSIGATTPAVSFHAQVVKPKPSISSSSISRSARQNGSSSSSSCTNPTKKIKLVSQNIDPTKYTRIADTPKYAGLTRSGETVNHVISTAARKQLSNGMVKTPVFKPMFSSTQSPVKKVEAKTFENTAAYGLWVSTQYENRV